MSGGDEDRLVLGIDVGTTATKVVAHGVDGREQASASRGYELHEPARGHVEQDPEEILRAVRDGIAAVVGEVGADRVAGLSFSAAMHSLIALDGDGGLLTRSLTWADTRAAPQAGRLRDEPRGLELHQRTGTPVHPMSPLVKLQWFAEEEPELASRAARWVGIKEYVLGDLCGSSVVDVSVASATGLLDLSTLSWDDEALSVAQVDAGQLGEPVPTTHVLDGLRQEAADALGLPASTPVVVGASDGVLANLGVGAVEPGVAACSIGTSGALRVVVDAPAVDPRGRVFCYALTKDRWVVGGAVNNGGVVLGWTGSALAPDLGDEPEEELLRLAGEVPPGSDGLIMLPYLLSERAPWWSPLPRGAYLGLTRSHGRGHLVRAAVEGVCQQLALVLASLRDAGLEVREVRGTGGFAQSDLWRQVLADCLDLPVAFGAGHEGSGFGAALLGMEALGLVESIDVATEQIRMSEQVTPREDVAPTYAALREVAENAYLALEPTFAELRRLVPDLPDEPA